MENKTLPVVLQAAGDNLAKDVAVVDRHAQVSGTFQVVNCVGVTTAILIAYSFLNDVIQLPILF